MNIHPNAGGFVIAAGVILGICAGLLWTAQGSLMLSYPTEIQKGRFISIFWGIFNLGGVVGASVSLALNFHSEVSVAVIHIRLRLTLHRLMQVRILIRDTRTNTDADEMQLEMALMYVISSPELLVLCVLSDCRLPSSFSL